MRLVIDANIGVVGLCYGVATWTTDTLLAHLAYVETE